MAAEGRVVSRCKEEDTLERKTRIMAWMGDGTGLLLLALVLEHLLSGVVMATDNMLAGNLAWSGVRWHIKSL